MPRRLRFIPEGGALIEVSFYWLRDWPGVQCVRALLDDEPLAGLWFNRTREYAACQKSEAFAPLRDAEPWSVDLEPLWRDWPAELRRQRIAEWVEEIEVEAAEMREQTGRPALGASAICAQDPHARPLHPKRSPAPRVHAASREVRRQFVRAYRLFVSAFRDASEKLKAGDREARFPLDCFPPALPFIGG